VVVPWRGGCPHRERAWRWVRNRYKAGGWNVVEAPARPGGPWCKAMAVTPAVEAGNADVVVIADADVWCDLLEPAVHAVASGETSWAVPHGAVVRLSEAGTTAILAGEDWRSHRPAERPGEGVWGGGIVVLRRDAYLDCPLDPRFRGWGQEDTAWAHALLTLQGEGWRGSASLLHLWHPPQERLNRQKGSHEGWALFRRYQEARRRPNAMRALLEEARCPQPA
jgi:hypothetical protein